MKQSPKRTIEELGAEYTQLCAAIGQVFYRRTIQEAELAELVERCRQLNLEAAALKEPNGQGT